MKYNFNWDFFSNRSDSITINKNSISFPVSAFKAIGEPQKIDVGYDTENNAISFRQGTTYTVHDNKSTHKINSTVICTEIKKRLGVSKAKFTTDGQVIIISAPKEGK